MIHRTVTLKVIKNSNIPPIQTEEGNSRGRRRRRGKSQHQVHPTQHISNTKKSKAGLLASNQRYQVWADKFIIIRQHNSMELGRRCCHFTMVVYLCVVLLWRKKTGAFWSFVCLRPLVPITKYAWPSSATTIRFERK